MPHRASQISTMKRFKLQGVVDAVRIKDIVKHTINAVRGRVWNVAERNVKVLLSKAAGIEKPAAADSKRSGSS